MSTLRIAAVTEDGERLSSHFGMAPLYRVFTVQDGQVVAEETRQKPHHDRHPHGETHHEHRGGQDHADMFAPIRDCQVLLVGGMGEPAYQKAQAAGLQVILSGGEIRPALERYLRGELESDPRRIHRR